MKDNRREKISEAVGGLNIHYLEEAECYEMPDSKKPDSEKSGSKERSDRSKNQKQNNRKKHVRHALPAIAAAVVLCILAGSILPFGTWFSSEEFLIKAYACETDGEITSAGVVMDTGSINDKGEQKGHPLMFYLSGKPIKQVRFSCEKQQLYFQDWTEQREEYGLAQNFTVPYGEKEEEYKYLTIDWEPQAIIEAIQDGSTLATLPEELREDRIVMEITGLDGRRAVKVIQVSLLEDGRFFAVFDDYTIQESDVFVEREDDLSLREQSEKRLKEIREQKEQEEQNTIAGSGTEAEKKETTEPTEEITAEIIENAEAAAREYYAGTVFEVVSLEVTSLTEEQVEFSVCVTKGGILQEPDRMIVLRWEQGSWEVTNEGY